MSDTPQTTLGLLGHNGAGKSTLLRYLAGHFRGIDDHPFLRHWRAVSPFGRAGSVLVAHPPALEARLTGREHFRLAGRLHGTRPDPVAILDRLGAPEMTAALLDSRAGRQSLGMRRRLALGLALAGPAVPLLLDEPFAGLDLFAREPLRAALAELRQERPLVVASNEPADLTGLADRVWILQQGRIAEEVPAATADLEARYRAHPPEQRPF